MQNDTQSKSGGCKDKDCNDCGPLDDLVTWLFKQTKYFFYGLVLYLYPSLFFRYFFRHGDYPWTDPWVAIYMLVGAFFAGMANWAHMRAGPAYDPGYLSWEHFRTEEDRRLNRADKTKWDGVIKSGKKIEVQETGAAWDPEQANAQSIQCKKCGAQKVDGVHHCSGCGRCVWKMDHHCPWTDNCVGYLTLKPFILFLFYVTALCFSMATVSYMHAWKRGMYHISLINLMPSATHFKHMMLMYFLTEAQKKEYHDEAEKIFQESVKFDEEHPEIFSVASLKHLFTTFTASKFSMFHNITCFMDAVVILMTLVLGCYTLFLACQTIWFQKHQSSLVESMKLEHWQKRPSMYRRELAQYNHKQKTRQSLTWTETLDAVMGEETLFTWKIFVPVYSNPEKRNMDYVSQMWLNSKNSESAGGDKKTD